MKKGMLVLLLGLFLPLFVQGEYQVIPKFQKVAPMPGIFKLDKDSRVVVNATNYPTLKQDLTIFKADLERLTGMKLNIVVGANPQAGDLVFALDAHEKELGKEGYKLTVSKTVYVTANTVQGAFYAMQSLLQLLKENQTIQQGEIIDFPRSDDRGFMIDLGRRYFEVEYIEALIRKLAWMKVNFIHLHFTEWNAFRLQSDVYPGLAAEQSYSKQDIRRIQDYAAKYHIMVIPEIDLPAHATAITEYNPDLGFKCPSMRASSWENGTGAPEEDKAWTLDISRPEVRAWIKALLDEWIPLFDGPYFHIGGDEYQYDKSKNACEYLVKAAKEKGYKYPGDIFVDFVNEVNEQVKSYGKTTMLWNWWRFCYAEDKQNKTSIQPSKDIVIDSWVSRKSSFRRPEILADGYKIIVTGDIMEHATYLYVVPGTEKEWFSQKLVYEQWELKDHAGINGYELCLWCNDKAIDVKEDDWFDVYLDLPIAIFAERTWSSQRDASLEKFKERFKQVGYPSEEKSFQ